MKLSSARKSTWIMGGFICVALFLMLVRFSVSQRIQEETILREWPSTPVPDDNVKRLQMKLSQLEQQLQYELLAKRSLQDKVGMLENQLGLVSERQAETDFQTARPLNSISRFYVSDQRKEIAGNGRASFEEILADSGVGQSVIEQIKLRLDENRMQLLSERNAAAREGRIDDSEYIEKMEKLVNSSAGLRDEFGDEIYDRYLYAADKPNRVEVLDTYATSAAESVGIRPGDVILRYGEQTIYTMSDLRQATVLGNEGDAVVVEVLRDGKHEYFTLPRGPIGVEMDAIQQRPY